MTTLSKRLKKRIKAVEKRKKTLAKMGKKKKTVKRKKTTRKKKAVRKKKVTRRKK